jgi:AcrR family transcriptional regulator
MTARASYHHGSLRSAFLDEAWEMARTSSPAQVTLREVARRIGVSHNAAYRHFADREDLMVALSERAMTALADAMLERMATVPTEQDPVERVRARLRETGRAYVLYAIAEPQLFQLAFHLQGTAPADAPATATAQRTDGPYGILNGVLDEMADIGAMPSERRQGAEIVCWAAVHGFAELCTKGPAGALPAQERDAMLDVLLRTVEAGLRAPAE